MKAIFIGKAVNIQHLVEDFCEETIRVSSMEELDWKKVDDKDIVFSLYDEFVLDADRNIARVLLFSAPQTKEISARMGLERKEFFLPYECDRNDIENLWVMLVGIISEEELNHDVDGVELSEEEIQEVETEVLQSESEQEETQNIEEVDYRDQDVFEELDDSLSDVEEKPMGMHDEDDEIEIDMADDGDLTSEFVSIDLSLGDDDEGDEDEFGDNQNIESDNSENEMSLESTNSSSDDLEIEFGTNSSGLDLGDDDGIGIEVEDDVSEADESGLSVLSEVEAEGTSEIELSMLSDSDSLESEDIEIESELQETLEEDLEEDLEIDLEDDFEIELGTDTSDDMDEGDLQIEEAASSTVLDFNKSDEQSNVDLDMEIDLGSTVDDSILGEEFEMDSEGEVEVEAEAEIEIEQEIEEEETGADLNFDTSEASQVEQVDLSADYSSPDLDSEFDEDTDKTRVATNTSSLVEDESSDFEENSNGDVTFEDNGSSGIMVSIGNDNDNSLLDELEGDDEELEFGEDENSVEDIENSDFPDDFESFGAEEAPLASLDTVTEFQTGRAVPADDEDSQNEIEFSGGESFLSTGSSDITGIPQEIPPVRSGEVLNFGGISDERDLKNMHSTIREIRTEREEFLEKIQVLEKLNKILRQENLTMKAEIDERRIELSVMQKRQIADRDEVREKLCMSEEKKLLFEEKLKRVQREYEKLEQKIHVDIEKIRKRERELENQLELVRMDATSQIKTRDTKIMDLKRMVDSLEFNVRTSGAREQKNLEQKMHLESRLKVVMDQLKNSIKTLEEEVTVEDLKKLKGH